MQSRQQFCTLISRIIARAATVALAIAFVLALTVMLIPSAQAQTYKVIYTFTGGADGAFPVAGLTADRAGNLYGTASAGGKKGGVCSLYYGDGCGTVFKLTKKNSQWVLSTLYTFQGNGLDGVSPSARVIFGPDGALYGTTTNGGEIGCPQRGCGTVFQLKPPPSACKTALCPWTETVLHRFTYDSGGYWPTNGDLLIDPSGVIYGTTSSGGDYGVGLVFSLTPSQGGWTYKVIYSFTGGTVYELTPSESGWTENTIFDFPVCCASYPIGGLVFDAYGNLYGAAGTANPFGQKFVPGSVYEIQKSSNNWTQVFSLALGSGDAGVDLPAGVTMDAAGNLYGVGDDDGSGSYEDGVVYALSPSNGSWTLNFLHTFSGGNDGGNPLGTVLLDAKGNLYGTASEDGPMGFCCGVVWEITP